jgi:hypothetical protein
LSTAPRMPAAAASTSRISRNNAMPPSYERRRRTVV